MEESEEKNPEFSIAAMNRVFKRAGGKSTVDARRRLVTILNELANEIARYSVRYAKNSGKTRVTAENVTDATRWVLGARKVGKAEEVG